MPRKKASRPEMKIVVIISKRICGVTVFSNDRMAAAVPVLERESEKIVMKERAMTIVLIEPTRNRKVRGVVCFISEERTAAWPEPMPGRNDASGAVMAAARLVLKIVDFFNFIDFRGVMDCFGREVLFFRDIRRAEVPKSPVSSGRSGSWIGRLKERKPRIPDKRKTSSAGAI